MIAAIVPPLTLIVWWLQLIARYAGCLFDAHSDKRSSGRAANKAVNVNVNEHTDPLTYYLRSSSSTWFMWPPTFERKMVLNLFNTIRKHTNAYNSSRKPTSWEADEKRKKTGKSGQKWAIGPWNSRNGERTKAIYGTNKSIFIYLSFSGEHIFFCFV